MIDMNQNEYYLFYEMMMQALKTDDVINGMNQSLRILKDFLGSGNIILHKKNENGKYVNDVCDATMSIPMNEMNELVNNTASITESRGAFHIDLSIASHLKGLSFIYIKTEETDYILSINNPNPYLRLEDDFWKKLIDTMQIILKRAESYEKNTKASSIDLLTELQNRNSYERKIQSLNDTDNYVYGIFDLFRLKYINDNYSHALGDSYIRETAKILKKYWPEYTIETVEGKEKKIPTGHNLYRIGGDEFVLITSKDNIDLVNLKARLAAEEVSMMDLGVKDLPIGLNHGVVNHRKEDVVKKTYINADQLLSNDKRDMYVRYGLDRRR
ncbi:MAG: GGDEF domain-containing protein [Bacilli bacterium]|nr:GGDEF domain-containing protein [Bacilli bacterium]